MFGQVRFVAQKIERHSAIVSRLKTSSGLQTKTPTIVGMAFISSSSIQSVNLKLLANDSNLPFHSIPSLSLFFFPPNEKKESHAKEDWFCLCLSLFKNAQCNVVCSSKHGLTCTYPTAQPALLLSFFPPLQATFFPLDLLAPFMLLTQCLYARFVSPPLW